MKITGLRTVAVQIPLETPIRTSIHHITAAGCLLVFLETDGGIVGESLLFTLNGKRVSVLDAMLRSLEPVVIGRDTDCTEGFWAAAWSDINFVGHTGVPVFGISAIDCALWDIKGKAAGKPIYRLLGAHRSALPVYASGGLWVSMSIDELVAETESFRTAGFRAMKMRLGSGSIDSDIERVRAVRAAIGPEIALIADAHQALTLHRPLRLGRRLQGVNLTRVQEPLPRTDRAGGAAVPPPPAPA